MNGEGVVFVYFNHGSKNFERVKISPAHAHMVIPTEKNSSYSTSEANSYSTQRSAQQPILGMPVQTAPLQQPTFGIPIQIAPSQQSMIMQVVLTSANTVAHTRSSPHQPINQGGDRTTSNSTGGFCTIAANTSKSIGYFKPVEFVAISPIRSFEHSRFC
jgi:hypothetical protein